MRARKSKAFSITELIVVMAIIAALTLIAVPIYNKYIKSAEETDRNALVRATYIACVAYYADNKLTEYINPSQEQLAPYLKTDVKIVSGIGKPNCNVHGHFEWGKYTGNDKENLMCVHIVLEGKTYNGAGIVTPADKKYIIIEMYDPTIEQQYNSSSETNVRYFRHEF